MFYAHIVLAKKGPLARIWLAAHWDKKLTKAHVFETNIEQSIEGIMQPKVKLALRTSGHLLLGVVRIYSRKAKYLLADCNEAFVKIKMAFRPGVVDLPEEHREAAVNAITLPEVFHDFDTALPELNDVDIEAQFSINQSRADEITMREDYGTLQMNMHDDGFGDIGFEPSAPDIVRNNLEDSMTDDFFSGALEDDRTSKEVTTRSSKLLDGMQENLTNDFGDTFEQPAAGLFEGDIFGEGPLQTHSVVSVVNKPDDSEEDDDDDGHFDGGAPSPIPSSENSRACTPGPAAVLNSPLLNEKKISDETGTDIANKDDGLISKINDGITDATNAAVNDEESFALAPIDSIVIKGINNKSKRKRKLIVDEIKNISGDEMKNQLANTTDIVTTLDLAPPTKRLMYWKETGGVEKLFALPSRDYCANPLFQNYQRQLITKLIGVEEFPKLGPTEIIITERSKFDDVQSPTIKKKRKNKQNDQSDKNIEPEVLRENDFSILTNITLEERNNTNKNIQSNFEDNLLNTSGDNQLVSDSPDHVLEGNFTPSGLDHGEISPNHCIENIDSIPNLHVDQVSSILNASNIEQFSNMGFENEMSSEKISHEWDGDYDYQSSENVIDEQGVDETMEQFEERVLNKRAAHLFISVRSTLQKRGSILLTDLTVNNNRKQAAQKFYSVLVLKKFQVLNLQQPEPYNPVIISKGPCFDNPKL